MEVSVGSFGANNDAKSVVRSARKLLRTMSPEDRRAREEVWVDGVRAGQRKALKKIYCAYHADLCGFAASYVDSENDGREVVQEVFLHIWERRKEWQVRGSLKAYLFQAVRNRALNFLRAKNNRNGLQEDLKERIQTRCRRTAEDHFCYTELAEAIESAVEELPPRRREAFTLHRQHGLSYKEIADVMGISSSTVANQISRALKALRDTLPPELISK